MNDNKEKLKQSIIEIQNFNNEQMKFYREKESSYFQKIRQIKDFFDNRNLEENIVFFQEKANSISDFQELFIELLNKDNYHLTTPKKSNFYSIIDKIIEFINNQEKSKKQELTSVEKELKKYELLFEKMKEEFNKQDKTVSNFNDEIEDSKKDINDFIDEVSRKQKELENEQSKVLEIFNKNLEEKEKKVLKIKEEAENAKTAFNEEHKLQASRQYWASKKSNHFWKAIISFILFLIIISSISYLYFQKIEKDKVYLINKAPMQMYIDKNVTNLIKHPEFKRYEEKLEKHQIIRYIQYVFLLSLIIWLLRIILKVTFSNLHLQEEAHEKETMILTYLALINEGAGLKEDDRKLILEAIFRPSTNGLIKDESNVTLLDLAKVFKSK